MKIKVQAIEFEGDQAAAADVLRMIGNTLGMVLTPVQHFTGELLSTQPATPSLPATKPTVKKPAIAKVKQAKANDEAPMTNDDDAAQSPLAEQIADQIRLLGPQTIPQLAVALRKHGAGIGKSVSASSLLCKKSDGLIYVVD